MAKKNIIMKRAKETVGLGVLSMGGMGAMGAMGNIPGMPAEASGVTRVTGAGLGIVNIGQMVKNAQTVIIPFEKRKKKVR